jgi:hypothetical protein
MLVSNGADNVQLGGFGWRRRAARGRFADCVFLWGGIFWKGGVLYTVVEAGGSWELKSAWCRTLLEKEGNARKMESCEGCEGKVRHVLHARGLYFVFGFWGNLLCKLFMCL